MTRSFSDYAGRLPVGERDQAEAAADDAERIMRLAAAHIPGESAFSDTDPDRHTQAVNYLRSMTSPAACRHIQAAPSQVGWYYPGVDRDEVKCGDCVRAVLADNETVARTLNDERCELCLNPSEVFHADVIAFAIPHGRGITSITAFVEACPTCHKHLGGFCASQPDGGDAGR